MDQRISFITLAVRDLEAAARASTSTGSAGRAALEVPGDVLMIRSASRLVLSLWAEAGFEGEVGPIRRGDGHVADHARPTTSPTREEVDAVLEPARAAGASTPATTPWSASGAATPATSRDPDGLPLGDRHEPRTDRTGGAAMSDPKQTHRYAADRSTRASTTGVLVLRAARTPGSRPAASRRASSSSPGSARRPRRPTTTPTSTLTYPHGRRRPAQPRRPRASPSRDIALARRISAIAAELGVAADAARGLQTLELALDAPDVKAAGSRSGRRCSATTGDEERPRDRRPRRPHAPRCGSSRHPSATARRRSSGSTSTSCVPREVAEERIDAALAAGGTLVSDDGGPGVLGAGRRRTATRSASAPGSPPRTRSPDANIRDDVPHVGTRGESRMTDARTGRLPWSHAHDLLVRTRRAG